MAERNICLTNDSFPPVIDGVANAVTNYARVIEKDYGSATVVTPYYPDADDSVFPFEVVRYPSIDLTKLVGYRAGNPLSAEVVQRLEEKHFDLIHTHCPVASTVLARILRDRIHVPLVFTYHTKFDIDIAHAIRGKKLQEAAIRALVEDSVDAMKVSNADVDLILVGGGSIILPEKISGAATVLKPEHFGCANAIGSAISKVSGTYEKLMNYDELPREQSLEKAKNEAIELAVEAGAVREVVDGNEMSLLGDFDVAEHRVLR